ncbi:hypothetical protein PPERSA_10354 [Pseudocohnilembus persalinus]|uniref:Uncharacterized protein n=1 Tax=Pseudocohnilembus persalinus TaxID=266149 RepID=A0A0V0R0D5_PSEPJ|nr:hypothetical protein PPERSA_10354 [Pseudocohnilembus persalinus]|eukprot:KRX07966.1 hypothetical protein PPERSA_10354 [Pseudocohnilembus persalinus]
MGIYSDIYKLKKQKQLLLSVAKNLGLQIDKLEQYKEKDKINQKKIKEYENLLKQQDYKILKLKKTNNRNKNSPEFAENLQLANKQLDQSKLNILQFQDKLKKIVNQDFSDHVQYQASNLTLEKSSKIDKIIIQLCSFFDVKRQIQSNGFSNQNQSEFIEIVKNLTQNNFLINIKGLKLIFEDIHLSKSFRGLPLSYEDYDLIIQLISQWKWACNLEELCIGFNLPDSSNYNEKFFLFNLKELNLIFSHLPDNDSLQQISNQLQYFTFLIPKLQELSIHFEKSLFGNKGISIFSESLKKSKLLEQISAFSLDIGSQKNISEEPIIELTKILAELDNNLNKICLDISHTDISLQGIQKISKILTKKPLKNLKLYFETFDLQDKMNGQELTHLAYNLVNQKISGRSLNQQQLNQIQFHEYLNELDLKFRHQKKQKYLVDFFQILTQTNIFPLLKKFKINCQLSILSESTYNKIFDLVLDYDCLQNLNEFGLVLSQEYSKIKNNTQIYTSQQVALNKKFKNLTYLNLNYQFNEFKHYSDIAPIIQNITDSENLKNLQHLNLIFKHGNLHTEGCQQIVKQLAKPKNKLNLQEITLDFSYNYVNVNISDKIHKNLRQKLITDQLTVANIFFQEQEIQPFSQNDSFLHSIQSYDSDSEFENKLQKQKQNDSVEDFQQLQSYFEGIQNQEQEHQKLLKNFENSQNYDSQESYECQQFLDNFQNQIDLESLQDSMNSENKEIQENQQSFQNQENSFQQETIEKEEKKQQSQEMGENWLDQEIELQLAQIKSYENVKFLECRKLRPQYYDLKCQNNQDQDEQIQIEKKQEITQSKVIQQYTDMDDFQYDFNRIENQQNKQQQQNMLNTIFDLRVQLGYFNDLKNRIVQYGYSNNNSWEKSAFKNLMKIIVSNFDLKNLENLSLNYCFSQIDIFQILQSLDHLSSWEQATLLGVCCPNLQNLGIHLQSNKEITNQGLNNFSIGLENSILLQNLRTIYLNFNGIQNISENSLIQLSKILAKKGKNLNSIQLFIFGNSISSSGLKIISEILCQKQLKKLALEFSQNQNTNGQEILDIINSIIQTKVSQIPESLNNIFFDQHLEELSLIFQNNSSKEQILNFFDIITNPQYFFSLSSLQILAYNEEINDEIFQKIWINLTNSQSLTKLKQIQVLLQGKNISPQSQLFASLKIAQATKFQNLEELIFICQGSKLNEKIDNKIFAVKIVQNIVNSENLRKLKHLSLDFAQNYLEIEGCEQVVEELSKPKNQLFLEEISLNFRFNGVIKDQFRNLNSQFRKSLITEQLRVVNIFFDI